MLDNNVKCKVQSARCELHCKSETASLHHQEINNVEVGNTYGVFQIQLLFIKLHIRLVIMSVSVINTISEVPLTTEVNVS